MTKNFLFALSVLIGTMVGAGIFGIPYVAVKSGIVPSFFYFLILGGIVLLVHLFFGEIILRTKENYRLIGFARKYLGDWSTGLITVSVVFGVIGALLAYLILIGDFSRIIFSSISDISSFNLTLIFWVILSYFVFRGIKLIAPTELLTNTIFFLVIFIILGFSFTKFDPFNLPLFPPAGRLPDIFLPYGVILFSLVGWSAIPEIVGIFKNSQEKRELKRVIILATIVVVVFYLLFAILLGGIAGRNTSPDTLSGLIPFLGGKIIFFGALAGLITIADSFLILALFLRNSFVYDLKLSQISATLITCGLPLILFLAGFRSFIGAISFVGTLVGAIEGIMIILIFKKAKFLGDREPEYNLKVPSLLLYFLIAILILGAISQFFVF